MAEPPISISSIPNADPDVVSSREFPVVRRGYDPPAVRRFLSDLSQQLRAARLREADLQARLAESERRLAEPQLDEETVSSVVGSETARILHAAHTAANDVLARAESKAQTITAEAETVGRDQRHRSEAEAASIVSEARAAAGAAKETTKEECRAMIDEAREIRRRILADLADRRRSLHSQIEQLRAGKDTLAAAIAHAAETITSVRARLDGSEEEARIAADLARRVAELEGPTPERRALSPRPPEPAGTATIDGAPVADDEDESPEASEEDGPGKEAEAPPDEGPPPRADPVPTAVVGELFAKLRASTAAEIVARSEREESSTAVGTALAERSLTTEEEGAPTNEVHGHGSDRLAVLSRRDELVGGLRDEVVHALKRALRVEQNELLSRLRSRHRDATPASVIAADASARQLAAAVNTTVGAIYRAGAGFATELLALGGQQSGESEPDPAAVASKSEEISTGLGSEIAAELSRALERAFSDAAVDSGALQRCVGAVFRDWKGERVENLAGDQVTRAFALGVLDTTRRADAGVTWVVDDGETRCSDCEDDELAGTIPAGTSFPTGQAAPPAHSGCRCVLVPAGN